MTTPMVNEIAALSLTLRVGMPSTPGQLANLLMRYVPLERWPALAGVPRDAPGFWELPPILLPTLGNLPEAADQQDLAAAAASVVATLCWRRKHGDYDQACEHAAMLVTQVTWFPPVSANEPWHVVRTHIMQTNRFKAQRVRDIDVQARLLENQRSPQARTIFRMGLEDWLRDALERDDRTLLRAWSRGTRD
jgi:hypothetical protein